MQEFIEKLIGRFRDCTTIEDYGELFVSLDEVENIINELAEEYNNGWIPCSEKLPPQPEENPLFDNKPLELYLVSLNGTDYPWRAFWNGEFFTDGWSRVEPKAWQPLPKPYQPKGE